MEAQSVWGGDKLCLIVTPTDSLQIVPYKAIVHLKKVTHRPLLFALLTLKGFISYK